MFFVLRKKYRQSLKTQGVRHSAQMMSDFRQNEAGILDVFQGFLTTKTALVGHYDECREVFRGCLQKSYESAEVERADYC